MKDADAPIRRTFLIEDKERLAADPSRADSRVQIRVEKGLA